MLYGLLKHQIRVTYLSDQRSITCFSDQTKESCSYRISVTDNFHGRQDDSSHWLMLITTTFVNYQPQPINMKLTVVTTYHDRWTLF